MAKKRKISFRLVIQIAFLVIVAAIAVTHSLEETNKSLSKLEPPSLHAVCPFGGVVSIYQYATDGSFVKKTHESSFILMIIVGLTAILFGPAFCGWICPFGTVQEFFGKIGKKIFKKKFNNLIPYKLDKWLRFLRYIMLAWVVYATAVTGKIIFADYDPYYALFNFWTGEAAITSTVILLISLILSLFVERPFCKYACPYGAVLGLSNFFRIFKIKRASQTCINCKSCNKNCPMNINVASAKSVKNHQCISCMKCTSEQNCPVEKTVNFGAASNTTKRNIPTDSPGFIVSMFFFVGIGLSIAFNIWITESSKIPSTYTEGEFSGSYNPADIRGSYTLENIEELFGINKEIMAKAFKIENAQLDSFKVKDVSLIPYKTKDGTEVILGTDAVRSFVSLYTGLPYAQGYETWFPNAAIDILKEKLSPADFEAFLNTKE